MRGPAGDRFDSIDGADLTVYAEVGGRSPARERDSAELPDADLRPSLLAQGGMLTMGHALWTSPITGYRRKGTRLAELRSILGAGITARAILEPLQSCPADAPAGEMADLLSRRDFDVAGVKSGQGDPVIGFVERSDLKGGVVRDHKKDLTAERLVSDATALPALLSFFKGRQQAFVLVGSNVEGIVTRADLNKPPVRVYLFGLISLLEMHLGFWIRDGYPENSWLGGLSGPRVMAAKRVQAERRRRHEEASLFECIQFCDKRDLLLRNAVLPGKMGVGETASALGLFKRAEALRNVLAHSQADLVRGSSWEKVISLVQWVEAVVESSDERIEQRIVKSSTKGGGAELWASA